MAGEGWPAGRPKDLTSGNEGAGMADSAVARASRQCGKAKADELNRHDATTPRKGGKSMNYRALASVSHRGVVASWRFN